MILEYLRLAMFPDNTSICVKKKVEDHTLAEEAIYYILLSFFLEP